MKMATVQSYMLGAILGLLTATPAFADECQPEFVGSTATVNVSDVEVGLGEFAQENFTVAVRNAGSGDCGAIVRLTRVVGISAQSMPPYSLRSGATVFEIAPQDATPANSDALIISYTPSNPQGVSVPFEISVPSEWGLQAGNYSEQLELSLRDVNDAVLDSLLLTVNINIPQAVALRIVGAAGSDEIARIHLGTVSATAIARSDPFGVRVWSTSGYRVNFSSENRGDLVHTGNLDRFEYQLFFDNQPVDLAAGEEFNFPSFTPPVGTVHNLRAQAGPATVRAGDYADRLTVSVTAI
jgi:hypothetical protein